MFHKIRQISYLYLDSKYGPIPFSFDLEYILINLPEYFDELFLENDSYISQSINNFDTFLSSTIYQSKESLQAQAFHVRKVTDEITDMCENNNAYSIKKLFDFLKTDEHFLIITVTLIL